MSDEDIDDGEKDGRTSITIRKETHTDLSQHKPDGVSWDYRITEWRDAWLREQQREK